MGWLQGLFRKPDRDVDSSRACSGEQAARERPPLMLLIPDAAGPASFKLESFRDVPSAESFLNFWFTPGQLASVVVFWALTWEPPAAAVSRSAPRAEPLALIRDPSRNGFVFPFSFSQMGAAEDFLRQEIRRGVDASLVSLYWAAPVRTQIDARGNIYLEPALPPLTTRVRANLDRHLYAEARAEAQRARLQREAEDRVKKTMERALRDVSRRRSGPESEAETRRAYRQFRRQIEALGEFDSWRTDLAPEVRQAIEEVLAKAMAGPEREKPPAEDAGPEQVASADSVGDELQRMRDELERFRQRWHLTDGEGDIQSREPPPGNL